MAETAYTIQYRQEYILGYEQRKSLLADKVTTESVVKGNQATFLVADSGPNATTTTRGVNGRIQSRGDNLSQPTATLTEEHDLIEKTGFNVFASQGDQRRIMQETSYGTVQRKMDSQILTALAAATQDQGAAAQASLAMFTRAKAILGNNAVPNDGNICAVISPAAHAYLMGVPEFTSADYMHDKHLGSGAPNMFYWAGMYFIEHPNLTGIGTGSETMFVFHKDSIGHAIDTAGMQVYAGYDEEQDYSWARATHYMGAVLLQNSGVVKILHDGSGLAAE